MTAARRRGTRGRRPPRRGARPRRAACACAGRTTSRVLAHWVRLEGEAVAAVGPGGAWGEALALDALAAHLRAAAGPTPRSSAAWRGARRCGGGGRPRGAGRLARRPCDGAGAGRGSGPRARQEGRLRRGARGPGDAGGTARAELGGSRPGAGLADLVAAGEGLDGGRVRVARDLAPGRRVGLGGRRAGHAGVVAAGGPQPVRPHHRRPRPHRARPTVAAAGVAAALDLARSRAGRAAADDPVLLVGHSQGGILAAALASDPAFTRDHRVTHVVTSGAPVGLFPVPARVRVLSVEHADDPVPRLDLTPNPEHATWLTVSAPAATLSGRPRPPPARRLRRHRQGRRGGAAGHGPGSRRLAGVRRCLPRRTGSIGVRGRRRAGVAQSTLVTPSSALATVLVDELVRGGVRDVVLCPGSRSAPLAYAVLAAERAGRLRLHVRVDERSAGFLALGLAAGSRSPVVVVTTSGTAVANLHPAVLEAHHAGLPLVVLSADRPHELRGTGANQTTAQPGIFGASTRWSADLPAPVVRPGLPPVLAQHRVPRPRGRHRRHRGRAGPGPPQRLACASRWPPTPSGAGVARRASTAGRAARRGSRPGRGRRGWSRGDTASASGAGARSPTSSARSSSSGAPVTRASARPPSPGRPSAGTRSWPSRSGTGAVRAAAAAPRAARPHRHRLARRPRARARRRRRPRHPVPRGRGAAATARRCGSRSVSEGAQWPDPSHVAAAVHPASALRPAAVRRRPRSAASGRSAGTQPADGSRMPLQHSSSRGRPAWPWPSAVATALPGDALLVVGSSNPVRDLDLAAAGPCRRRGPRQPWPRRHRRRRVDRGRCGAR